jgi:hypothetical protein
LWFCGFVVLWFCGFVVLLSFLEKNYYCFYGLFQKSLFDFVRFNKKESKPQLVVLRPMDMLPVDILAIICTRVDASTSGVYVRMGRDQYMSSYGQFALTCKRMNDAAKRYLRYNAGSPLYYALRHFVREYHAHSLTTYLFRTDINWEGIMRQTIILGREREFTEVYHAHINRLAEASPQIHIRLLKRACRYNRSEHVRVMLAHKYEQYILELALSWCVEYSANSVAALLIKSSVAVTWGMLTAIVTDGINKSEDQIVGMLFRRYGRVVVEHRPLFTLTPKMLNVLCKYDLIPKSEYEEYIGGNCEYTSM